jgi:hypothetical protein
MTKKKILDAIPQGTYFKIDLTTTLFDVSNYFWLYGVDGGFSSFFKGLFLTHVTPLFRQTFYSAYLKFSSQHLSRGSRKPRAKHVRVD